MRRASIAPLFCVAFPLLLACRAPSAAPPKEEAPPQAEPAQAAPREAAQEPADLLIVHKSVNLRPSPSTAQPRKELLYSGTRLERLDRAPSAGFFRVRAEDGSEGWVWQDNVREEAPPRREFTASERFEAPLDFQARAQVARARAKASTACADSLAECPREGCQEPDSPGALLNIRKKTFASASAAPIRLSFKQLEQLQEDADDTPGVRQGEDISAEARKRLEQLEPAGEGDYVEIMGFIAPDRNLRWAGPESVNCRLSGADNNDIHIPMVEEWTQSEFDSVVVEPVPQRRSSAVTIALLHRWQEDGTLLRIRGQLFYDNKHRVNADPDDVLGSEPKRFTIWEVHPVTELLACNREPSRCDPDRASDWKRVRVRD